MILRSNAITQVSYTGESHKRYRNVTEEGMRELYARIFKPIHNGDRTYPALGIRRLKEDEIETLPHKNYRVYSTEMPEVQASAYEEARCHLHPAGGAKRGAALKLLHHIRSVSLHPLSPQTMQSAYPIVDVPEFGQFQLADIENEQHYQQRSDPDDRQQLH